jgi:hypothetical protein
VTNNNGPARLLLNDVGHLQHWLGLRLVDGPAGARRDVLGAVVTLSTPGRRPLRRRVLVDGSYLSSSDPRVLFGLADSAEPGRIRVEWPDGLTETWSGLPVDSYHQLVRGSGTPTP